MRYVERIIMNIILWYNIKMSALLNHNESRNISWKGRTINQITSSIQKNGKESGSISKNIIFHAMPLKIYRREMVANIPTLPANSCKHSRISSSIDEFTRPGGCVISATKSSPDLVGQSNTLELSVVGNLNETNGCKSGAATSYNCAEKNARRRCRSSGVIKRVYDSARSEMSYFTNTNQYLVSRSKTFVQNQYRHVRPNEPSIVTSPLVSKEIFSPNGVSHCPKTYIAEGANVFYYYWIDASGTTIKNSPTSNRYTVTIPVGYYDVKDLNGVLESAMYQNRHYFVFSPTHSKIYLMKFIYNNTNNRVELQTYSSFGYRNAEMYLKPIDGGAWSIPTVDTVPVYSIPNTGIQDVIGFRTGFYPDVSANVTANQRTTAYGILSNLPHKIRPSYSITYYKPSNNRFGRQGGVSSSDMTTRVKYETITRNGLIYAKALGSQVGNAMSYGVSDHVYTLKDKIGFPATLTPVIDKYTGEMKRLANGRRTGYCTSPAT